MNGLELLHYLENQCKSLSEWKEKQVIVKKISKNLYTHIQEIITKNGCKITCDKEKNKIIISKLKEDEEDLLAGLDDLWDWPVEEPEWLKKEKLKVAKKEKEVAKMERVVKMNPSRTLSDMVDAYNKELDKKHIDIDNFYKIVKEAHTVILTPWSYVDTDTYNNFITSGALKMIIGDLKRKMRQPYYKKFEKKIKEIIKMLEDIDKKAKSKDYGLA